jgi:hypothetical protein
MELEMSSVKPTSRKIKARHHWDQKLCQGPIRCYNVIHEGDLMSQACPLGERVMTAMGMEVEESPLLEAAT